MKYAYLALIGVVLVFGAWALVALPIVDWSALPRARAQRIVDDMDFVRHASGLCFGVTRVGIVQVPSEKCDHPWAEMRQQGRTP